MNNLIMTILIAILIVSWVSLLKKKIILLQEQIWDLEAHIEEMGKALGYDKKIKQYDYANSERIVEDL